MDSSNAGTPPKETALVLAGFQQLGQAQWEIAKRVVCPDANDDEAGYFLMQCNRLGLDPFKQQVYFIVTERDGQKTYNLYISTQHLKTIVLNSGLLEYLHGPYFASFPTDGTDEPNWLKYWPYPDTYPDLCKFVAKRVDRDEPTETVRYWSEVAVKAYNQKTRQMYLVGNWKKRPLESFMRVTSRKVFTDEFGELVAGIGVIEEMPPPEYEDQATSVDFTRDPYIRKLFELLEWPEDRCQRLLELHKGNKPAAIVKLRQEFIARNLAFPELVEESDPVENIKDADIVEPGEAVIEQPEPTPANLDEVETPAEVQDLDDFAEGEPPSLPLEGES